MALNYNCNYRHILGQLPAFLSNVGKARFMNDEEVTVDWEGHEGCSPPQLSGQMHPDH